MFVIYQGRNEARAGHIIDLASQYLGIDGDRLRGRGRDRDMVEARHLLCYLLARAGYRPAAIARLLDRNHSTILHAVARVERCGTLCQEGRRLAEAVLPFAGERDARSRGDGPPRRAISHTLLRALLGLAPLNDVRAVRAYVCGSLLGCERVPAVQAAWGLHVIAAQPTIRAAVAEVLNGCGLPAYRGLIDLQIRRMGLR